MTRRHRRVYPNEPRLVPTEDGYVSADGRWRVTRELVRSLSVFVLNHDHGGERRPNEGNQGHEQAAEQRL